MTIGRRTRLILIIVAAVIGAGIVAAIVLLETGPARQYTVSQIRQTLGRYGVTFAKAKLGYRIANLDIVLEDVVVRSPEAPDLPPMARIPEVLLRIDLPALIRRGEYVIEAVLVSPALTLVTTRSGQNNLVRPGAAGKTTLKGLVARNGSLVFEDRSAKVSAALPAWSAEARSETGGRTAVRFDEKQAGWLKVGSRTLPITALALRADAGAKAFSIRELELRLAGADLTATGTIGLTPSHPLNLSFSGTLSPGTLLAQFGKARQVQGGMQVRGAVTGPLAAPEVTADVRGRGLRIGDVKGVDLNARALYQAGSARVRIPSFTLGTPDGSAEGEAVLALTNQGGNSAVDARLNRIDLRVAGAFANMNYRVASFATGTLAASWPALDYGAANGKADLRLTAIGIAPRPGMLPVTADLTATFRNRDVALNLRSFQTLGATGYGRITVRHFSNLGGTIHARTANLAQTLSGLQELLGTQVSVPAVSGPGRITFQLAGTLKQPVINFELTAPGTGAGGGGGTRKPAESPPRAPALVRPLAFIRLKDAVVVRAIARQIEERQPASRDAPFVRAIAAALGQQETPQQGIVIRGRIELGRGAPQVQAQTEVRNQPLEALLGLAGLPPVPVGGQVSARGTIRGAGNHLQGSITLTVPDFRLYGQTLGRLTARIELAGTEIRIPTVRIERATGFVEGSVAYDRATGVFQFETRARDYPVGQLVFPGGVSVSGIITLQAKGSGTGANPDITATAQVADLTVQGHALGPLSAEVNVANRVANVKLAADSLGVNADARIGIQAPYPAGFTIAMRSTPLAAVPLALPAGLAGTIAATLAGDVPLAEWSRGRATARIENLDVVWNGITVRVAKPPLVVGYDNGVVNFEPSTILAGDTRISVAGSLSIERPTGPGELTVKAHADLRTLSAMLPLPPGVAACGTLEVNSVVRGSLLAPVPAAAVSISNGCLQLPGGTSGVTNISVAATLGNGEVIIETLSADWAGGRIQARGTVPLGIIPLSLPIRLPMRAGAAELALDVTGLNLRNLPGVPAEVGGTVSARVELRAHRPELTAVTGTAVFSELTLDLAGVQFHQTQPSELALANGVARFTQLTLAGPETTIRVSGTAGLMPPYALDLRLSGEADAALIALATEAVRARGAISLNVNVTGTATAPSVNGTAQLKGVQMAIPAAGVQVDDLNAEVRFAGESVTIERLNALVNGGTMTASGSFAWTGRTLRDVALDVNITEAYLNYPEGLKTISNAPLRLRSEEKNLLLSGKVTVLDGTYREPVTLERLLALSRVGAAEATAQAENPFLAALRLNVELETEAPIVVENNLARISALANLRVTNTASRPGLVGGIDIEEGGELYLAEHTYIVQRGIVQFTSERRIQPSFDVLAGTEASNFEITLTLTGEIGKLQAQFTSQPPLPEPDIISLLLTGRTLQDIRGSEVKVASEEALSYLSGQLASTLGRQAEQVFGLTRVSIEPSLIVADANPTARLTVGERITHELNLVYSMDLSNSADQIWIAEYNLTPRFLTRALKQQNNTSRFEFRDTVEFGPVKAKRPWFAKRERMEVRRIAFAGDVYFTEEQLRHVLGIKPGGRYDFFTLHNRVEKLRKYYADRHFLEARIRMRRVPVNKAAGLLFTIDAGPVVEFVFEGWSAPGGLRKEVRRTWVEGVFDLQRLQDATNEVQAALVRRGYVNADIQPRIVTPEPRLKRVVFVVRPGTLYRDSAVVFAGNNKVSGRELRDYLKKQNLQVQAYTNAPKVVDALTTYYHDHGFLDAHVSLPDYLFDPGRSYARATIPIVEGPHYRLARVVIEGSATVSEQELRSVIPGGVIGGFYRPELRGTAYAFMQEYYWKHGYTDIEATYSLAKYPAAGIVDLILQVNEGRQRIVRDITVSGTEVTSPSLVRGEVTLKPGQPLNLEEVAKSRSNLYNTGAYWLVDMQHEAERTGAIAPSAPVPVRLAVNVKEIQPFSIRYGGLYDTEGGPGGIVDFANRNSLGAARVLGLRLQYDSQFRESRLYFAQPSTSGFFLKTGAALYAQRQAVEPYITHRYGFSISEDARFTERDILTFGYRIEQASARYISPPPPGTPASETSRVAPLSATFTHETRNAFMNPTRGGFLSQSLEYGSKIAGSQEQYLKYFGQYLRYVPLARPVELPLTMTVWRSEWVYAGAVRVGLAGGLGGQQLPVTERFFAGGATSVRGYSQNSLGPTDAFGNPVGGNAMFLVNNELRFPLYSILGGAIFLDAGNVYATVSDFDPLNLRYGAGVGLRLNTPYLLLRFDAGFKLFRRPGESLTKFYFSIGQAF